MAGTPPFQSSLRRTAQCLHKRQCRTFTSTPRSHAAAMSREVRSQIAGAMGKQKSMQSQMKNLKGREIPNDLGLMPETLVKGSSGDLPSLLSSQWRRRLQVEWRVLFQKARDFVGLIYINKLGAPKDILTNKRRRQRLYLHERYVVARELHRQLYTSLAVGNYPIIQNIACQGLQKQTKIKLDYRRAAQLPAETWTITYRGWTPRLNQWLLPGFHTLTWLAQALCPPFLKSTRIIVDRQAQIPIGRGAKLRQVIVKIKSRQTLNKHDGKGEKTKDCTEYVVIQKMTIDNEEGEWMIWGTTEPTKGKKLDELLETSATGGTSVIESLKQRLAGYGTSGAGSGTGM